MGGIRPVSALALAVLTVAALAQPAASQDAAAIGLGEATFPFCPSDRSVLVGLADNSVWTFVVVDVNPFGISCGVASGDVFHDVWDPALGGCLDGIAGELCLTDPIDRGFAAEFALGLCLAFADCVYGTATLVIQDL